VLAHEGIFHFGIPNRQPSFDMVDVIEARALTVQQYWKDNTRIKSAITRWEDLDLLQKWLDYVYKDFDRGRALGFIYLIAPRRALSKTQRKRTANDDLYFNTQFSGAEQATGTYQLSENCIFDRIPMYSDKVFKTLVQRVINIDIDPESVFYAWGS